MPYSYTTPNFGFPKYEGADCPNSKDFNDFYERMDYILHRFDERLKKLESAPSTERDRKSSPIKPLLDDISDFIQRLDSLE